MAVVLLITVLLVQPLEASRPVLKVLTTFDPAIRTVSERVHEFEARHHCWVDWDYVERSVVEERLFGESIDYDVVSVDEPWVAALSERLLPLADWPVRDGAVREAHPLASWQGRCYGLMQLENYYFYVYRADVFADTALAESFEGRHDIDFRPPEKIEELLPLARFFEETTPYHGLAMVQSPPESVVIDLVWCLEASGVALSGESMRNRPDFDAVRLGLQRFQDLHRLSSKTRSPRSLEGLNQAYSRAEVPHVLQWSGFSELLRNPLFSRVGTKTSYRLLPGSDIREPFCMTGHWFLCIPAAADQRVALAADFIDWYHEIIQQQSKHAGNLVYELDEAAKVSRPRSEDYLEVSKRLYAVAEMTIKREASLDECARWLIRELSQLEFTNSESQP